MAYSNDIRNRKTKTLFDTITGTSSVEFDLEGGTLVGVITPASLASTAITFSASVEAGGTAYPIVASDKTVYTLTTDATARYYYVDPTVTAGVGFITLTMGSSETAKTITLVYRNID